MQLEGYTNLFFFLVDSSHKIYFNSIYVSVFQCVPSQFSYEVIISTLLLGELR